jgi:hypothetical protein
MGNARNLADNLPLEGHLAGRNVIINGAMNFSQRQASSSNVGNQYVLDRFAVYKQNTGSTYTCSQNSVTDLAGFSNSLKMDCTTADTSIASNEEVKIVYKMEGQDLQRFKKGHATALGFTLSFYAKTNKTGVYCVELYDRDNGREVSGSYTVADANWNRYTISFPADTTGKFDDNNGSSLELSFWLVAGSAVQGGTLNTTWRSATDPSSATGQVNFADNTSNDWEITGVQLEVGSSATPFEHEPYSVTLSKAQRYYYSWVSSGLSDNIYIRSPYSTGTPPNSSASAAYTFPVTMRANPTITTTYNFSRFTASVHNAVAQIGTTSAGNAYAATEWQADAEL